MQGTAHRKMLLGIKELERCVQHLPCTCSPAQPQGQWLGSSLALQSRGKALLAESHCTPLILGVPSPAQGPRGLSQVATEQQNGCGFIARCTVVLYILPWTTVC